jgi:hypothetical protein
LSAHLRVFGRSRVWILICSSFRCVEIQTKYRSQFREQAKNIIKTANPEATEEQIEEAIEEGRLNVFSDQALARNQAAKNALAYVQVRRTCSIVIRPRYNQAHYSVRLYLRAKADLVDYGCVG